MDYTPGPFPLIGDVPSLAQAVWDELQKISIVKITAGVPVGGGGGSNTIIGGLTSAAAPAGTPQIGALNSAST